MKSNLFEGTKVVVFDADDTLWENETFYRDSEEAFSELMSEYLGSDDVKKELLEVEIKNLPILGFGIKGFIISMVETAMAITEGEIAAETIKKIIKIGKDQLEKPVHILENVKDVLSQLKKKYRLILATKGDLLEQEIKIEKSGLIDYFEHCEVLSDKKAPNYRKLFDKLKIKPAEVVMIGNSVKSDVLPIIEIGGKAIHIPYHTTWEYEKMHPQPKDTNYLTLSKIKEVPQYLL